MAIYKRKQSGFTIVELLIVIVVIGILAAITIVAYNGVTARANDSKMRSAVNQLEKAMQIWASTNGNVIKGGFGSTVASGPNGCTDGSSGWFAGTYVCGPEETLVAGGVIKAGFTASLPKNTYYSNPTDGKLSLMLYGCGAVGKYSLYWTLQSPSSDDSTNIDNTLITCGNGATLRDTYGMRAAKIITLQS